MPIPELSQLQKHCSSNQIAVVLRPESHRREFKFPPASWLVHAQTNRIWAHAANMIGRSAESQQHIHSINKCNDPNLNCADYLPWYIVWPAKLYISRKPDTFCSAALIASALCLTASTRRGWCLMEWVLIARLTWHLFLFYLSGSHLIKQSVPECDFTDIDSNMVERF